MPAGLQMAALVKYQHKCRRTLLAVLEAEHGSLSEEQIKEKLLVALQRIQVTSWTKD